MKEIGALVGMGVNEHAFLHGLECEGVAGLVYFTLSQDSSAKTLFADGIVTKLTYPRTGLNESRTLASLRSRGGTRSCLGGSEDGQACVSQDDSTPVSSLNRNR